MIGHNTVEDTRKTGTDSVRVFEDGCLSPLSAKVRVVPWGERTMPRSLIEFLAGTWPFLFRSKRLPLGRQGENAAARYLRLRGYRILGRNVVLGRYEIDIIARKGDTTAFVEVKTRRDNTLAEPEETVHRVKRQRIRRAAHRYIAQRDDPAMYYRFDIASILIPEHGKPTITYFENAFPDE